jgi:putative ABC transport system permease protein
VFNDLFDLPEGRFKGIFSDQVLEIDSEDLVMNQQMDDVLTSFETYAGMIKMMLLGLGFLSSAMALLILYILIALLIEENSRSIALLKILGYDSREIRNLILRTLNLPVLVGFALGIPLLFSLYGRMLESSFAEIDMTMPLILSPKYMVAGFALLYATYLLTRKITGRKIFKISMTDGLKSMQE